MREYPLDFRQEETHWILERWAQARSLSSIGVGSVGKSNLIQHLIARAGQPSRDENARRLLPILLDANLLPVLPADPRARSWAGFELIMHRLYLTTYPFDMLERDAEVLYKTYKRLQDGENPLYAMMALRYLELGLSLYFRRGYLIVLLFDEFELFLQQMPTQFFLNLRGLRDMNKSQLAFHVFAVFARAPIARLCERYAIDALHIEPFAELFADDEMFLGPYRTRDAVQMIAQASATLPESHGTFIVEVTGGFAGLIRTTTQLIAANPQRQWTLQALLEVRSVQAECEVIHRALDAEECAVLDIALGKSQRVDFDQESVDLLVNKRLLTINHDGGIIIRPPLFEAYLRHVRFMT